MRVNWTLVGRIAATVFLFWVLVALALSVTVHEYFIIVTMIVMFGFIALFVLYSILALIWDRDPFDPRERL